MRARFIVLTVWVWALLVGSSPATAQTIDPALHADIVRLMTVTEAARFLDGAITEAKSEMIEGVRRVWPDAPQRALDIVSEVFAAKATAAMNGPDGLVPRMVVIYANHFTHDEIRGMLAFYESDLGRKMIALTPAMLEDVKRVAQDLGNTLKDEIQTDMEKRLRAEGFIK